MKISKTIAMSAIAATMIGLTGCGGSAASGSGTSTSTSTPTTGVCPAQTTDLVAETALVGKPVCQLDAQINSDLLLTSDKVWSLGDALVKIGDDAGNNPTLSIQAGTTLYGKVGGALIVQRGAKINAIGTSTNPVIMTGEGDVLVNATNRGQWAGLVIAGRASNNNPTTEVSFEFETTLKHGGIDDTDNSGILKYVVVKHAGQSIVANKEFNAVTLGSVGSGTTIDYVEAYNGKDDGFELFGGTVNMKHLVLIANDDDQLDTDEGYKGNIQYVYAEITDSGEGDPSGFEFSSTGLTTAPAVRAEPKVANFTILGANKSLMTAATKYNGIRTKDNTLAWFVNGEILGFPGIEGADTDASGMWRHQNDLAGAAISDVYMAGMFLDAAGVDTHAFSGVALTDIGVTDQFLTGPGANNSYNVAAAAIADERAELGGDTFFDIVGTRGASVNTWATGWAVKADGTTF